MKIIDTYEQIVTLHNNITGNADKCLEYWNEYIEQCASVIKSKIIEDSSGYDYKLDIEPVLINALVDNFNLLRTAHQHFLDAISRIEERFTELFPQSYNTSVYFYVGLCNGAGWATIVDDANTVLLGAEKIVELRWHGAKDIEALLYHELCHIAHGDLRGTYIGNEYSSPDTKAVWQLYTEGFAQRYEQVLVGKPDFYHQDKQQWLDWCKDNKSILAREYLNRVLLHKGTSEFFGDWTSFMEHADIGYYLGCEFIKSLESNYSLKQIATLSFEDIQRNMIAFLEACQQ